MLDGLQTMRTLFLPYEWAHSNMETWQGCSHFRL